MLCCSAQHGALRERLLHLLFKGRKRPGSVFRFPPIVSCLLDDKAPRHGRRAINDPNESSDSSSPCPHVARTADRPRNVAASACGVEHAVHTQDRVYAPALDGGNVSAEGTPTRESSEAVTATVNIMARSSQCTGGGRGGLRSQLTQMLPEDIRAG